jgi:hypothetical protein
MSSGWHVELSPQNRRIPIAFGREDRADYKINATMSRCGSVRRPSPMEQRFPAMLLGIFTKIRT